MFSSLIRVISTTVAVLALSASAARAEIGTFTAGGYPATVSAAQVGKNVFKFGSWEISCGEVVLSSTLFSASAGLQMNQSYGGCTTGFSLPVTVRTNGCVYAWKLEELEGAGTAGGRTSGSCGGGAVVEFDLYENAVKHKAGTPFCTYGVPPQIAATIKTHNGEAGGIEDVVLTLSLTGIEVKVLKGTKVLCGAAAGGTVSGSYTGTQTLTATKESEPVSLMVG
jgi:hypothetical protein